MTAEPNPLRADLVRSTVDGELVARLVAEQFPLWADLPVRPVATSGWDNRTFHLGEQLSVRLPSGVEYADQVEKEHRWLPWLGPRLPVAVPEPVALGAPGAGYPFSWSVYRWLPGETALAVPPPDLVTFATDVGGFLTALQAIDASDGPPPGAHNFERGGSLTVYDADTRRAVQTLAATDDRAAALESWEESLAAARPPDAAPVWVHGDVAVGNLLTGHGRLSAVIDFGCLAVGDPACDLVPAWTLFDGESRVALRAAVEVDEATWLRARGWALWKALITLRDPDPVWAAEARRVLAAVLADGPE